MTRPGSGSAPVEGSHAVDVRLRRPGRPWKGATAVPTGRVGTRRLKSASARSQSTLLPLRGGCVTYEFAFADTSASLFDADNALAFARSVLVDEVRDDSGLRLCGAGAPCPGGS